MVLVRRDAQGVVADKCAVFYDVSRQRSILRREDGIDAATEDGDGASAGEKGSVVGAESMPWASPLTIVRPARVRSPTNSRVTSRPYGVAILVPTTANASSSSARSSPLM